MQVAVKLQEEMCANYLLHKRERQQRQQNPTNQLQVLTNLAQELQSEF